MNKKMIIYMPKLSVGGMEQSLINMLNLSTLKEKYDITLCLGYSIEKEYLNNVPQEVNLNILWKGKWNIVAKLVTAIKLLAKYVLLSIKKTKYDVSISYAYQHGILALLARKSSDNNIIFVHSDLCECREAKELKKLQKKVKFEKFKKIVCVSSKAKESFYKLYPNYQGKTIVINNYIDIEKIITKSKERCEIKKVSIPTFIHVGRHVEKAKQIMRILLSAKALLEEGYKFRVVLVGDGEDHNQYQKFITENKLEKNILMLGKKTNPYPYIKNSDCLILSSKFEGYGMVLDEARTLEKPFITTNVADSKIITEEGYGILCDNSKDGIYKGMKEFLDNGYFIKNKFNPKRFNQTITERLEEIVR